jgi:hypothetical protein
MKTMLNQKPKDILNRYNILLTKIDECDSFKAIDESLVNINLFNELYKDNELYFLLLITLKNKKNDFLKN